MTRVIWALIIAVVVFIGYRFYLYWESFQEEHDRQKSAPVMNVSPESLPGMPEQLQAGFHAAKSKSPAAFSAWFKANESELTDPSKAWVELDLCIAIRRDNPVEAKAIFARVKKRIPPSSPVWPRMKELENAFE
jgi:hypothetical protein